MFESAVIGVEQLKRAQQQGADLAIFDCRFNLMAPQEGVQAYSEGHLVGAHYANLDTDLASAKTPLSGRHPLPEPEHFAQWLGERGVGPQTWVVAYDAQNSLNASRLWWLARWIGHSKVVVLDGGFQAAVGEGMPLTEEIPSLCRSQLQVGKALQSVCELDAVLRLDESPQSVLVDVRAAARFKGEMEPIDPIAGHIPGAINIPIDQLVTDGFFNDTASLKARFEQQVSVDQQPIFMCGSGITACQAALAFRLAGLGDAAIYPGSWSEWIKDSQRKVALGAE